MLLEPETTCSVSLGDGDERERDREIKKKNKIKFYKIRYSRTGKKIPLLGSITASLPTIFVDGEFWYRLPLCSFSLLPSPPLWIPSLHPCLPFMLLNFVTSSPALPLLLLSLSYISLLLRCLSLSLSSNSYSRFGRGMFSLIYLLVHGSSSWPDLRYLLC
jgi:hypothetical protein